MYTCPKYFSKYCITDSKLWNPRYKVVPAVQGYVGHRKCNYIQDRGNLHIFRSWQIVLNFNTVNPCWFDLSKAPYSSNRQRCWLDNYTNIGYMRFQGSTPILEGLVVSMNEGACEQEVKSRDSSVDWFDVLFAQAWVHCDNKLRQIGLNHNFHIAFSISGRASIPHLEYESHCYVTWRPLTTGIVASQCPSSSDATLVTRHLIP